MSIASVVDQASGLWEGSNGFRLMPGDPLSEFPAAATLSVAAGGYLGKLDYTWTHPEDGAQEGLLAFGIAGSDNSIVALWADSWHQHPEAKVCEGGVDEHGVISVGLEYGGGWRWQIILDTSKTDVLVLRMDNVIPPDAATEEISAGPYVAMSMELHQTA
jgi:hypothetical protein